jgi:PAS domain S-box-containing protein
VKKNNQSEAGALRRKAEEQVKKSVPGKPPVQEHEPIKLLHELEVHRIELELQNEELMLARDKAEAAAAKYSELYDFAPCGYFTLLKDGRIGELNLPAAYMLGKDRSSLKDKRFGLFVSDDKKKAFLQFLERIFTGVQRESIELTMPGKEGRPAYLILKGILSEKGDQCFMTAFDITLAWQANRELSENMALLESIINGTTDNIFVKDIDGKYRLINTACAGSLGMTAAEVIGRDDYSLFPADEAKIIMDGDRKALASDSAITLEDTVTFADGRLVNLLSTKGPVYDANGDKTGIFGIARDVTSRKRQENLNAARLKLLQFADGHTMDELLEETLNLAEWLTGSLIGFYHLVEADQKTLSLQNWSTRTKKEFCHAEGKGLHYDLDLAGVWADCLRERRPVLHNDYSTMPGRKGMPAGHAEIIRELAVPVMRNGNVTAILGVGNKPSGYTDQDTELVLLLADLAWDIIGRKKAEEEIRLANKELGRINAEKDKFFSIIAHDLRGPFNSFLGFTQMMAEDLPSLTIEEIGHISKSMRKSATNLYGLLENLLKWSRIQRGLITYEPGPFLLLPFIEEKIQSVREMAVKKGIEFTSNIPVDLEVFADLNMLGSVVNNLAANAVKFTSRGGHISISAIPENGLVKISVQDTGIGMNPDQLDKLFNLVEQPNRMGTDGEPSTGLGLLICRDFIEKLGGSLLVESEEGIGSTFHFTLPAADDRSAKISDHEKTR